MKYSDSELALHIERILAPLGEIDTSTDFMTGIGYIQHRPETIAQIRRELAQISKPFIDHFYQSHPKTLAGKPWFHCLPHFKAAWCRVCCIDPNGKEWAHPKFSDQYGFLHRQQLGTQHKAFRCISNRTESSEIPTE